jgi:hypothetical protein
MKNMNVKNHVASPHTEENTDLMKILSGRLKRLGREKCHPNVEQTYYWPAEFFGLQQSTLFNAASKKKQLEILTYCSNHLLREAYFIEKLGITYCAKMVLLSDTTETAQAYSLIGADEATHLQWISPYVPQALRTQPVGAFLVFLTQLVQHGDTSCLMYLLQVILEGWGLHHYKNLASYCNHIHLQNVFADIVRDEALHHKTGSILFQPEKLTMQQKNFILTHLADFLEMIRVGPQAVLSYVELVLGDLNKSEKIQLIDELAGPQSAAKKLKIVKQLMIIPGCERMIEKLNEKNLFNPYSSSECV